LEYTVIFEPAEEGGYVVSAPSIPCCTTQGETFEEASANIKDTIQACLAVLREEGEDIPQEKSDILITKIEKSFRLVLSQNILNLFFLIYSLFLNWCCYLSLFVKKKNKS